MIFKCILLALSASIDALSLGITYGIKHTKISSKWTKDLDAKPKGIKILEDTI